MNQRRRWRAGELVEVSGGMSGTWRGTVIGEHLDGPRVRPDAEPDKPRNVYYRDAHLLPAASQPEHIRELSTSAR